MISQKSNKSLFAILVIFYFVSIPSTAQKVRLEKGIRFVENGSTGLWDKSPKVKLNYAGLIGDVYDTDKSKMLQRPAAFAIDREGNVYVADAGTCRIQKYDKNLKYVSSIGRKGRGPGEFLIPNSIAVGNDNLIYLNDTQKASILVVDQAGKEKKSIKLPTMDIDFSILSDGNIVYKNPRLNWDRAQKEIPLFFIADKNMKTIKTIGVAPDIYKLTGKRTPAAFQLSFCSDESNNIYAAYSRQNKIEKYSYNGSLIMSIKRKVSSEFAFDGNGFTSSLISEDISVDSKGRIWVLTAKRNWKKGEYINDMYGLGPNMEWVYQAQPWPKDVPYSDRGDLYMLELFDKDGSLLYKFQMDRFFRAMKIFKNRIYLFDFRHTTAIYVYEISDL